MRALVFSSFGGPLTVETVPDPACPPAGVVVRVGATGVCRSDWHGWQGHDPDVRLPHVPGHELAGTVEAVGPLVTRWSVGDRVTVPFVCACGACPVCLGGDPQVCPSQTQPGFTHWGSFATYVALDAADVNLVRLPDDMDFSTAASLGCRFATAFRAVAQVGRVRPDEWVVVHGCGGVGLSAVQVAVAHGARVVAVDVSAEALALASSFGALVTVDASAGGVVEAVVDASGGGAALSLDCLGSAATCVDSVLSLARRGRHVQVGLLPGGPTPLPMDRVIGWELEVLGSHGMAASSYPQMLSMVASGKLRPDLLVTREISLDDAADAHRDVGRVPGVTGGTSV